MQQQQALLDDRRNAQMAAQAAAARNQQFRGALGAQMQPVGQAEALVAGGGPTNAAAGLVGQQRAPNWQGLAAQFPEQAELLQKLASARDWGAPEVARTVDTVDAEGRPATVQLDKQGRPVGQALRQWKAPVQADTGGQLQFIDPVTQGVLSRFQKTNSPDSLLSAATARRGQDLVSERAGEANRIASGGNVVKAETDLRKEFADLPEVKNFKAAMPSFVAIQSAAGRNNPQADINLIYGLAKLYDPTSVVREGEYATIANSQAIPEWLKGEAQRLGGGGRLTPQTKAQILVEAQGRIGAYEAEYQGAKKTYEGIAQRLGGDPDNVFTPVGASRRPSLDMFSMDSAPPEPSQRPPLGSFIRR